jgi:transposase-like protein
MRKERKHFNAEEKVAILRRHLLDKVPVSDLCEEVGLRPTVFYRWQKEFFENGAAACDCLPSCPLAKDAIVTANSTSQIERLSM